MVNFTNVRQKILLTGTCWYELTGLWYLLSGQGYEVYRVPLGYSCVREGWDLIIVALSAEPVAGWGRHLAWIRELRSEMSGEMLVLAPERLKKLKMLRNVCEVYSGCEGHQKLMKIIRIVLTGETEQKDKFFLTDGQSRALKRLSGMNMNSPLSLKREERELYYHYARLAENVGVRDVWFLLMVGLDRELSNVEGGRNVWKRRGR